MKHKNSIERKSENMRCGKRVIALMVAGVFGITVTNGSVPVYAMENENEFDSDMVYRTMVKMEERTENGTSLVTVSPGGIQETVSPGGIQETVSPGGIQETATPGGIKGEENQETGTTIRPKETKSPEKPETGVIPSEDPAPIMPTASIPTRQPVTPNPAKTNTPATTKPGKTNTPVFTIPPRKSEAPVNTRIPEQTIVPVETMLLPPPTKAPVKTIPPVATLPPAPTLPPEQTVPPVKTEQPVKTLPPVKSEPPVVTAPPNHTEIPEQTKGPGIDNKDDIFPTQQPAIDPRREYCRITYQLNGGRNHKKNPAKVKKKGVRVILKAPCKLNYTFEGWYTDRKYVHKVTTVGNTSLSFLTLYAKWKKVTVKKAIISYARKRKPGSIIVQVKKEKGVSGFEYVYAKDSYFRRKYRLRTTKNPKTLSKLTKKKIYYIKVRAYKIDSTGKKIYGTYSWVKRVKA